ncbi:MAG: 5'-methylthioadenosine/S-adenosylhomocysteine nucleosidase [Bacteroidales bacterium]
MKKVLIILLMLTSFVAGSCRRDNDYAVVVSANAEWRVIKKIFTDVEYSESPWGEFFYTSIGGKEVLFFHEGWGKVAAAGATQYVIDRFDPGVIINIGTCGGFEGEIERMDIVLAEKTVIYDIIEAMGDSREAISSYSASIDLSWLGDSYPVKVRKTLLVSADRDLRSDELPFLKKEYSAVAGDWETGAIAYTALRNKKKLLILRGVSDLVSEKGGEAYNNFGLFEQRTDSVMRMLVADLPKWIDHIEKLKR